MTIKDQAELVKEIRQALAKIDESGAIEPVTVPGPKTEARYMGLTSILFGLRLLEIATATEVRP